MCEFIFLCNVLSSNSVLSFPKCDDNFVLQRETGGVLLKETYISRVTLEVEGLAVVYGVQHFGHYVIGRHFRIETDRWALQFLQSACHLNGRLSLWIYYCSTTTMRFTTDRGSLIQMPMVCQGSRGKILRMSRTTTGSDLHKEGKMLGSSGPTWQLMLPNYICMYIRRPPVRSLSCQNFTKLI